jgi:TonB-linked SusC/RagA family outer membrane protein
MRVSLHCFLFCVLCGVQLLIATPGKGQGIAQTNVILTGDKIPLQEVFTEIEKQTDFLFLFPLELINNYEGLSIGPGTRTVKETLETLFRNTPLVYQQVNSNILVFRAEQPAAEKTISSTLVTGKVTDVQGEGMPGVNVIVKSNGEAKGTIRGTTTEADGKFSIDVQDDDLLVFTSIGYKTVEMTVGNQTTINLTLEEDVLALQEVVVNAGYWEVKGKELTGSIYKVKVANPVQQPPVNNVLSALTGMIPGVYIQQLTGVPGGGFKIQIRGQNSIRAEANDPLYVIDGVPFTSSPLGSPSINRPITDGGNPLNSINPADIESVEVLKDADATSIYGSLGANGVVLITTKKAQEGKTRLDVNFYTGAGQVANRIDLLNTAQYLEMRNEAFKNDGMQPIPQVDNDITSWDTTRYTDWQNEMFGRTAPVLNARASLSGGARNTRFLISTAYYEEGTAFPGDFLYQRISSHLNLDHTSENERFSASLLATFALDDNDLPQADGTSSALILPPNAPAAYDEEGNLNWAEGTFANPFASYIQNYGARTNNLISNLLLRYKVLPGLELKSSTGYTSMRLKEIRTRPKKSFTPFLPFVQEASSTFGDDMVSTWLFEPQAEYKKAIGKGSLTALIGATFRETVNERELLNAEGYSSDAFLENIKAAADVTVLDYGYTQYRYQAFFSRLNFNWDSRYILNITARRDGSSRFGPGRQFALFGAVGAAWIFSNELFYTRYDFLSFGKLRASYGTTGSDQIGDYQYLDTFTPTYYTYGGSTGLQPTRLANQQYGWESNKKFEVALELGFLDNRILATTAYYRNRSSNQLVGYSLPLITGFPSIQSNLDAVVQNAGIEAQLTTVNISAPDFSWTTSINYSRPRNKLISYPNIAGSPYAYQFEVGKPLSIQRAIHYTGVDPQTGLYTFEDFDGDGEITTMDAQFLKSITQDFFGGFQNTFHYKRWDLSVFFQFVKQTGRNHMSNILVSPPGWSANQPVDVMNRWQTSGDVATVQKFSPGYDPFAFFAALNYTNYGDGVIGDASFIRLKNMYVSYTLPGTWSRKILVQTSKIYLQAQNLLTITSYKGLDPETQSFQHIPPLRVITGGVQLTF